jgi:hypothetical protein
MTQTDVAFRVTHKRRLPKPDERRNLAAGYLTLWDGLPESSTPDTLVAITPTPDTTLLAIEGNLALKALPDIDNANNVPEPSNQLDATQGRIKSYVRVPEDLYNYISDIGSEAFTLYCILLRYAWHTPKCWPSQARLAVEMGCSERQLRRLTRKLETAGLVVIDRATDRAAHTTPSYFLRLYAPRSLPRADTNARASQVTDYPDYQLDKIVPLGRSETSAGERTFLSAKTHATDTNKETHTTAATEQGATDTVTNVSVCADYIEVLVAAGINKSLALTIAEAVAPDRDCQYLRNWIAISKQEATRSPARYLLRVIRDNVDPELGQLRLIRQPVALRVPPARELTKLSDGDATPKVDYVIPPDQYPQLWADIKADLANSFDTLPDLTGVELRPSTEPGQSLIYMPNNKNWEVRRHISQALKRRFGLGWILLDVP